jgi:hypothetical protein
MYFPLLEEGGICIIEDLHASYWYDWEGGLFYTMSSMSFFKLLADTINSEHWGNGHTAEQLISNEFSQYADLVPTSCLDSVYSVQFFNSICIVEKCSLTTPSGLGRRFVSGRTAAVVPDVMTLNGSSLIHPDQRTNPYSLFV